MFSAPDAYRKNVTNFRVDNLYDHLLLELSSEGIEDPLQVMIRLQIDLTRTAIGADVTTEQKIRYIQAPQDLLKALMDEIPAGEERDRIAVILNLVRSAARTTNVERNFILG